MNIVRWALTGMVAVAFLAAAPNASAALKHIDASCGMHRGNIVVPFKNRYHVRIGPKHSGGRLRCFGRVVHHTKNGSNLSLSWISFDLPSWHYTTILDVGASTAFTTAACTSFVGAFVGEVPSIGTDTGATLLTGAACVAGGKHLQDQLIAMMRPRG